ncbi:hypothetical protein BV25DRAFT_1819803 [Artomyces pyxidatus]|uniref:Uncharacterized protein n=1 Tax=Artomyces pyxidatus TaxID=48021 RepID=A0ACB8TG77_9AGAM|nr:hypothetical protein BV25DRAFT_1819803 [Artomyces pyxidatus]
MDTSDISNQGRTRQTHTPEEKQSAESHVNSKQDLPPPKPKEERGVRSDVSPPLSNVTFNNFIHILAVIALAFVGWYIYRATTVAVAAVKGTVSSATQSPLWGLFGAGSSKQAGGQATQDESRAQLSVESRIEELAQALGMPSPDLASAIAGAVKEYVPPASLSSIASGARKTGGSEIVAELLGEGRDGEENGGAKSPMGGVAATLGSMVGTDDVPGDW